MSTERTIRRLEPADAQHYRAFMLEAYANHPEAFTSSPHERAALPLSWWEARLHTAPDAPERVLGAFVQSTLVAAAGLAMERGIKTSHKSRLFGMVVAPAHRRFGVGEALVKAVLDEARRITPLALVQLTVTDINLSARQLYARCGFIEFGLEPMAVCVDGQYFGKCHMWFDLRAPR
jgi:GNAT superfamily N-acetyltransferase